MIKQALIFIFTVLATSIYSQSNEVIIKDVNSEKEKNSISLPNRYRSLSLKYGPRTLNAAPGIIAASFIDDSPSGDNFFSTTNVKDKYNRLGVQLAYEWRKFSGLNHSLYFDLALGDGVNGGVFGYSIGWNFPLNNEFIIRPGACLAFGNNTFDLGQIENTSAYIQIGENQYYDSYLDVGLEGTIFIYGPQLDLRYVLGKKFHVLFNINYDLGSQIDAPKMVFTPPTISANDVVSHKFINSDNPFLNYNGKKLDKMPYDLGGLRLSLGFGYVWPRD